MTFIAFLGIVGGGVALLLLFGHQLIADADDTPTNPTSITMVRAHRLTPGIITTEQRLTPRAGCATSVVSYHSDGLKEYALAQRPAARPPQGGYPVVVFAHGYTDPKTYHTDNTQYASEVNWYCDNGYLVFKPDYRGHGRSEGYPDNGLYSPVDTYDVLNLVASLPNYPLANAGRVALVGHSMGGGIVLRAAVASHGLPIKAVVTLAGAVDSLPNITYHWGGKVPPDVKLKARQVIRTEGPPNQNPDYWQNGSSINYLASLTAPIQIHQGLSDASVPASFALHLDAALTAAGKSHELYTYASTGHLFTNPASMSLFLNRSTAFLASYDR